MVVIISNISDYLRRNMEQLLFLFYDFSFKFTIKNSTFQISNPTFKNLCVIFHDQKDYYDTPLNCITQVHIWVKTTLYQNTRRKCKLYNFGLHFSRTQIALSVKAHTKQDVREYCVHLTNISIWKTFILVSIWKRLMKNRIKIKLDVFLDNDT